MTVPLCTEKGRKERERTVGRKGREKKEGKGEKRGDGGERMGWGRKEGRGREERGEE